MFIKCAGSAGLSMLSEKAFLPCLSSPVFELIPECRIYFSPRSSTWPDCIFLSLSPQPWEDWKQYSSDAQCAQPACVCGCCSGGGGQTLLPVRRRLVGRWGGAEELLQLVALAGAVLSALCPFPSAAELNFLKVEQLSDCSAAVRR